MQQPPLLPDDTQPRAMRWDDTQPNPIVLRQRWWRRRGRWILVSLIAVTSLTLVITLAVLFQPVPTETVTTISNQTITLHVGSRVQTIQTGASTVGDMLTEQGVNVSSEDAVSHHPADPIQDGMTITISRARDVTLTLNGNLQTLKTPFENPLDILNSANISLTAKDKIWLDGSLATLDMLPLWTVPVTEIEIRTALTLTVMDNGETTTIHTTADTVGDALFEAGITLYLTDLIAPSSETALINDMQITIERAIPIQLIVDGVTVEARTNAATVADVLTELNAPLFGLDYVKPDEDTPVTENMTIEIIRVTEEVITTTEPVSYDVTYQSDANMNLDEKALVQNGKNGLQETLIRVRYENGIEVSRTEEGTTVTESPINEVIAYGTNIVLQTIDTPEGPREYWRTFRVYATSYYPEALGGDNVTAIGATLEKGVIGADPKIIPWRTQMYVPGYGVGRMADTGGPRSSPFWIDLGYSDEDWEAWYHYVDVYLLTPIPDDINYLLPEWTALR